MALHPCEIRHVEARRSGEAMMNAERGLLPADDNRTDVEDLLAARTPGIPLRPPVTQFELLPVRHPLEDRSPSGRR